MTEEIKLREYEAFEAFMRLGTVRAAAKEMNITQPMVSRLLGNLESKIALKLFEGTRNAKTITAEARLFHPVVVRALVTMRQVRDEAVAIANKQKGNIVVAAQPIYCDTFLLDAVAAFKKKHPNVGVRLVDVGMVDLMSMINDRSCDVGFGITLEASMYESLVTPLAKCEARCLVPTDHELADADEIPLTRLSNESFVELSSGSPLRTHVDSLMQRISGRRHIAAEMRHLRGVCGLVERGAGIAIVDPMATLLVDETKAVPRSLDASISWDLALFQPLGRPMSTIAEDFCSEVYEQVALLRDAGLISDGPGLS